MADDVNNFDEDQLLAYIEGELNAAEAEALERRLADQPRIARMVNALREDRALLQQDPEPALPRDFMSTIESRLARPMLMEPLRDESAPAALHGQVAPGEFRRKQRRDRLRRRAVRWSVAASVLLSLTAAAWFGISTIAGNDRVHDTLLAWRSGAASFLGSNEEVTVAADQPAAGPRPAHDAWPPHDAIVHHHMPQLGYHVEPHHTALSEAREMDAADNRNIPAADVILVIRAHDAQQAERDLQRLVRRVDNEIALVQNFSFREAQQLAEQWRLTRSAPDEHLPMAGAGGRGPVQRIADHAQRQLRVQHAERTDEELELSRQLTGPRERMAPFLRQIEHSSRGATHTMTLTVSSLHALLGQLSAQDGLDTRLAVLPDEAEAARDRRTRRHQPRPRDPEAARADEARQWLADRRETERLLHMLESFAPDALLHIPVRIESAE